MTEEDLRHLGATLKRRARLVVPGGLALATASLTRYSADRWASNADWCAKEALLWVALVWVSMAWLDPRGRRGAFGWWSAWRERPPTSSILVGALLAVAWGANCLAPYTGLQFHHSAAMLSNLRIDEGCWNSLIVPEAIRVRDPYVRIDRITFGERTERDGRSARIIQRLWSPPMLRRARSVWCRSLPRPIRVRGTYRSAEFQIAGFCANDGWVFGDQALPGYRRYQVNLSRACPQACVH